MAKILLVLGLYIVHVYAESLSLNAIAESNSLFSREYFKVLKDVEGNMVSSPLSAYLVLSMTQLGAGGSTASQMSRALHLPADVTLAKTGLKELSNELQSENSEEINIKIANRMYVKSEYDIEQEFLNATRDTFNSEPQSVDFVNPDTRNVINQWVEQQTDNKIKDLVEKGILDDRTRVVLVNTLYFKGSWDKKFNPGLTSTANFYTSQTDRIQVPMMEIEDYFNYNDLDDLNARFVELPYKGNKLSFVILLPNSRTGLSELENKMQTEDLSSLIDTANSTEIKLVMPKFKIETTINLQEPLEKLGMGEIFLPTADFSGITSSERLRISKCMQKTIIEVAENGTVAASATYVVAVAESFIIGGPPLVMIDHPFLFYLVHRTTDNNHVVLFSGRVVKPEGYEN